MDEPPKCEQKNLKLKRQTDNEIVNVLFICSCNFMRACS